VQLRQHAAPQMQREVAVCAAESSNEVVLACSDSALSGVAPVNTRGNELEINTD